MVLAHRVAVLEDMSLQVLTVLKKRKSDDEIRGRNNKRSAATHVQDYRHGHGLDGVYPEEHNHTQDPEQESGDGHGQGINGSEGSDHTQILAEAREIVQKSREKKEHWCQNPIRKRRRLWCCSCDRGRRKVQNDKEGGGGICADCGHSRCSECLLLTN